MEGCWVWIIIFVIVMMLVSYGLAGTMIIIAVLGLIVLLILGIGGYFSFKNTQAKEREALSIQHEEKRLRDQREFEEEQKRILQFREKERMLKQKRLDDEKQLLSLLEQCGGSFAIGQITSYLQSKSLSWEQRTNYLEFYLLQLLANKVNEEHIEVLQRKRKQGVFTDDYGRTISDKWNNDLVYYIKKVFLDELFGQCDRINGYPIKETSVFQNRVLGEDDENIKYWSGFINNTLDINPDEVENSYDPNITGHDYEQYVAELIELAGWAVLVTKGSGDHGADIIATNENRRIAVQCKKYNNPVGNKSVQEVFSAASFYDCAFGCVVSNTDFTTAARQAAAKLDVPLLHHEDVTDYFTTLRNQFEANEPDYDNT